MPTDSETAPTYGKWVYQENLDRWCEIARLWLQTQGFDTSGMSPGDLERIVIPTSFLKEHYW